MSGPKAKAEESIELLAYDLGQASAALGIDRERLSNLVRIGVVPHITLGTRRVIGKRALEEWLTEACHANATRPLVETPEVVKALRRRSA